MSSDLHGYIEKCQAQSKKRKRSSLQLEVMFIFKESIEKMIDACFPIKLQIAILVESMPKFKIAEYTYRNNLESIVGYEALRSFKINMYFLHRLPKVREVLSNHDTPQKQFAAINKDKLVSPQGRVYITFDVDDFIKFTKKFEEEINYEHDYLI